ncbi:hypothetical protein DWW90_05410 [Parabacteroides sp. AF17-28]|nr:hypothetical protein DWW90_05410 [Parabacteroides sp. AF17-28]
MIHYVFCLDFANLNRAGEIITIAGGKYKKKSRHSKPGLPTLPLSIFLIYYLWQYGNLYGFRYSYQYKRCACASLSPSKLRVAGFQ